MNNTQLQQEIKDCIIKNQNAISMLKDGKQILAYNKLLGLNQKLQSILKQVASTDMLADANHTKISDFDGKVIKYGENNGK